MQAARARAGGATRILLRAASQRGKGMEARMHATVALISAAQVPRASESAIDGRKGRTEGERAPPPCERECAYAPCMRARLSVHRMTRLARVRAAPSPPPE